MSVNNFEFLSSDDIPDNEDGDHYENDENERFENIVENIGENSEQTNPQAENELHNDSSSEDDIDLIKLDSLSKIQAEIV
ncbi:5391_t:CDS:1, partial [Paraglomus occultum]